MKPRFGKPALVAAIVASVALVFGSSAAVIALQSRSASIHVVCAQVRELRSNLVTVLNSAELGTTQAIRQSPGTAAEKTEAIVAAHRFYEQQRRLISPVHCP